MKRLLVGSLDDEPCSIDELKQLAQHYQERYLNALSLWMGQFFAPNSAGSDVFAQHVFERLARRATMPHQLLEWRLVCRGWDCAVRRVSSLWLLYNWDNHEKVLPPVIEITRLFSQVTALFTGADVLSNIGGYDWSSLFTCLTRLTLYPRHRHDNHGCRVIYNVAKWTTLRDLRLGCQATPRALATLTQLTRLQCLGDVFYDADIGHSPGTLASLTNLRHLSLREAPYNLSLTTLTNLTCLKSDSLEHFSHFTGRGRLDSCYPNQKSRCREARDYVRLRRQFDRFEPGAFYCLMRDGVWSNGLFTVVWLCLCGGDSTPPYYPETEAPVRWVLSSLVAGVRHGPREVLCLGRHELERSEWVDGVQHGHTVLYDLPDSRECRSGNHLLGLATRCYNISEKWEHGRLVSSRLWSAGQEEPDSVQVALLNQPLMFERYESFKPRCKDK